MAYIKKDDELAPTAVDVAQRGSGAPSESGSGSAVIGGASPTPTQPTSSGSFVNLQRYIEANAPQAQRLASTLGGEIGNQAEQARNAIKTSGEEFGKQVQAGTLQYQPEVGNLIKSQLPSTSGAELTPEQKGLISTQAAGQYAGPNTVEETGLMTPAQQAVGKVTQTQELAKTAGGQQELLRTLPGATPYARGGLTLEQLLLQNVEPAKQTFEAAVQATTPITAEQRAAQAAMKQQVEAAKTASAGVGTQVKGELAGAVTGFQSEINKRVEDRRAAETARRTEALAALHGQGLTPVTTGTQAVQQAAPAPVVSNLEGVSSGLLGRMISVISKPAVQQAATQAAVTGTRPSQRVLDYLGITADRWDTLQALSRSSEKYGVKVNLSDYLKTTPVEAGITPETVASKEEAARYQALAGLAGGNGQYFMTPEGVKAQGKLSEFDPAQVTQAYDAAIASGKSREQAQAASDAILKSQEQAAKSMADAQAQAQKQTNGVLAGAAVGSYFGPIGTVVGGFIGGVLCYGLGTKILMKDYSYKEVQDLKLGDETYLGGMVTACGQSYADDLYNYKGCSVTGSHAVFEEQNGKYVWTRVNTSIHGERDGNTITAIVYPIMTENHLLVTNTHISADVAESDNYNNFNDVQLLEQLNENTKRNDLLVTEVARLFTNRGDN